MDVLFQAEGWERSCEVETQMRRIFLYRSLEKIWAARWTTFPAYFFDPWTWTNSLRIKNHSEDQKPLMDQKIILNIETFIPLCAGPWAWNLTIVWGLLRANQISLKSVSEKKVETLPKTSQID